MFVPCNETVGALHTNTNYEQECLDAYMVDSQLTSSPMVQAHCTYRLYLNPICLPVCNYVWGWLDRPASRSSISKFVGLQMSVIGPCGDIWGSFQSIFQVVPHVHLQLLHLQVCVCLLVVQDLFACCKLCEVDMIGLPSGPQSPSLLVWCQCDWSMWWHMGFFSIYISSDSSCSPPAPPSPSLCFLG